MSSSPGYRKLASLNDMIHCVVYVVDTNNSSLLTPKMLDKFDAIRRKANRMGERCTIAYTCLSVQVFLLAQDSFCFHSFTCRYSSDSAHD